MSKLVSVSREWLILSGLLFVAIIVNGLAGAPLAIAGELLENQMLVLIGIILPAQLFGFIGVGYVFLKRYDVGLDAIDFTLDVRDNIMFAVIITVLMILFAVIISYISLQLGIEAAENQVLEFFQQGDIYVFAFVLLTVFIVAPAEEFLFRGVVQYRFNNVVGPIVSIVLTSILFSLFHIPAMIESSSVEIAVYLVSLFVGSLLLGYAYERTNNLFVPIISHAFYNSVIALQFLFVVVV